MCREELKYDKDITLTKRKKLTVQRPIVPSRPSRLYVITVDYITEIFSLFLKENILQILLQIC